MKKIFSWVPNFLTLCNLFSGSLGIVFAFEGNYQNAFWMCILSGLFDFCDGFAARLLKAYSPMGKELDSLADVVSFGLLPSMIMYSLLLQQGAGNWSLLAFIIVAFSALRLAKFNIDENQSSEFIGMPTPACALFFVSYAVSIEFIPFYNMWINLALVGTFSFLLVSPIPMLAFKFKNFSFKENADKYIFILVSIILLLILRQAALGIIIICYAIYNTVIYLSKRLAK